LSDLRPDSPIQRPDTARPRQDTPADVAPPTLEELEAIHRHLVRLPGQEGAVVDDDTELGVTFVRGPGSGPDLTYAAMPHWDADTWADALAAVRARMLDEGSWPSLLLTDRLERPVGLPAELERQGWMPVVSETVMVSGRAAAVPHLDAEMRIEAVRAAAVETHEELERRVFGFGADQAERRRNAIRAAIEAGALRAWVVWLGQEPVAVARLSQADGAAGLQGIGVIAGHRGQGYGTLITTVATRTAMATGNRLVWLSVCEDNEPAVRAYDALGFERVFSWTRWLLTEDPRRR
jgi:ribosomal protein S18 acetylase RimI-like enzyme